MKLIKNDYVDMDWDAEGFFESRENGFVGAVWIYSGSQGEIPVCFHDSAVFILADEDGNVFTREQIRDCLAECNASNETMEGLFEENYIPFGTVAEGVNEDNVMMYGLTMDDAIDIVHRLEDVCVYWQEIEIE